MVIAQLNGGLGNQLFQYAAAKSLSLHHQVPLRLDITSFYREALPDLEVPRNFELAHFKGVQEKIVSREELLAVTKTNLLKQLWYKGMPRHRRPVYKEPFFHFDPHFYHSRKNVLLRGGWQSEKYFIAHRDIVATSLELKDELVSRVKEKARVLSETNTVGVHIRRGDYMRKQIIFEWHGVMPKEYYFTGLNILDKADPGFKVLYFTDDPEWVEAELIPQVSGEIVSKESGQTHLEDFYLMSCCRHNIIANSSFSWWAAWLNKHPRKMVIGPKKWFDKGFPDTQDIIPETWTRI